MRFRSQRGTGDKVARSVRAQGGEKHGVSTGLKRALRSGAKGEMRFASGLESHL